MKRILFAGLATLSRSRPHSRLFAADVPVYKKARRRLPSRRSAGTAATSADTSAAAGARRISVRPFPAVSRPARVRAAGWAAARSACNWQTTPNLVLGIEGDWTWTNINGSGPFAGLAGVDGRAEARAASAPCAAASASDGSCVALRHRRRGLGQASSGRSHRRRRGRLRHANSCRLDGRRRTRVGVSPNCLGPSS